MIVLNISAACKLSSSTNRVPIARIVSKDTSTIRLNSSLVSPALNLYVLHIANIHCNPANTWSASLVPNSCRAISRKSGHFPGKSYCRIFWRTGMRFARISVGDDASTGRSRLRKDVFSSSGIGLCNGFSSNGAHPLFTRFLIYTHARAVQHGVLLNDWVGRT